MNDFAGLDNAALDRLVMTRDTQALLSKSTAKPFPGVLSSAEFVAGFDPPDYLVKGIVQKRFFYSLTARTGDGKTAIALLLAAVVALGRQFAGRRVTQGKVLYFAGENPDDVRMRWIAMSEHLGFDADRIEVHFVAGVFSIPHLIQRLHNEAEKLNGVALVIIDTSAAYATTQVDEENSNTQLGNFARELRKLTGLPGGPCVIACCHPVKNASNDNLIPRGGGAYLAEVDGNMAAAKDDAVVHLSPQGKFRGAGFDPLSFELASIDTDKMKDADGDRIATVMARAISEAEQQKREETTRGDEDTLLLVMSDNPGATIRVLQTETRWGASKTDRVMKRLKSEKLVALKRGHWRLTDAGKAEAKRAETPE